jgi:TetR/AcrR family transcriptional repressor of nem operon
LPPEVATEVKAFFKMCLDKLAERGLSRDSASELLATITGAMVVANALDEIPYYDRATRALQEHKTLKDRDGKKKVRKAGRR